MACLLYYWIDTVCCNYLQMEEIFVDHIYYTAHCKYKYKDG